MLQLLATYAVCSQVAQAVADSGDLSDTAVLGLVLASIVGLGAGVVHWLKGDAPVAAGRVTKAARKAGAPAGQRQAAPPSRRKIAGQAGQQRTGSAPPPSSRRREMIVLYAVTPGQTPHEYNLGDSEGTRGVARGSGRVR